MSKGDKKRIKQMQAELARASKEQVRVPERGMSAIGSSAGKAMQGIGSILDPIASVFVQQAKSNADIIGYQQMTQQAAIGANKGILHELDKPFLTVEGHIGRKGKRSAYKLEMSVLDLYALGDSFERAYCDSKQMMADGTPTNFSIAWWDVRAPRIQVSGYQKPSQAPTTAPGLTQAEREAADTTARKNAATEAEQSRAARILTALALGGPPAAIAEAMGWKISL